MEVGDPLGVGLRVVRLLEGRTPFVVGHAREPSGREVLFRALRPRVATSRDEVRRAFSDLGKRQCTPAPGVAIVRRVVEGHDVCAWIVEPVGPTLRDVLAQRGPLPLVEAADLTLATAAALAEMHGRGLVHGGLRPSRVGFRGTELVVRDFGVAYVRELWISTIATRDARMMEPLAYDDALLMNARDPRRDVRALGLLLYELLTGRAAYPSELVASWQAQTKPPPRVRDARPDVPGAIDELVAAALAPPAERPGAVAEIARALAPFATGRRGLARWPTPRGLDALEGTERGPLWHEPLESPAGGVPIARLVAETVPSDTRRALDAALDAAEAGSLVDARDQLHALKARAPTEPHVAYAHALVRWRLGELDDEAAIAWTSARVPEDVAELRAWLALERGDVATARTCVATLGGRASEALLEASRSAPAITLEPLFPSLQVRDLAVAADGRRAWVVTDEGVSTIVFDGDGARIEGRAPPLAPDARIAAAADRLVVAEDQSIGMFEADGSRTTLGRTVGSIVALRRAEEPSSIWVATETEVLEIDLARATITRTEQVPGRGRVRLFEEGPGPACVLLEERWYDPWTSRAGASLSRFRPFCGEAPTPIDDGTDAPCASMPWADGHLLADSDALRLTRLIGAKTRVVRTVRCVARVVRALDAYTALVGGDGLSRLRFAVPRASPWLRLPEEPRGAYLRAIEDAREALASADLARAIRSVEAAGAIPGRADEAEVVAVTSAIQPRARRVGYRSGSIATRIERVSAAALVEGGTRVVFGEGNTLWAIELATSARTALCDLGERSIVAFDRRGGRFCCRDARSLAVGIIDGDRAYLRDVLPLQRSASFALDGGTLIVFGASGEILRVVGSSRDGAATRIGGAAPPDRREAWLDQAKGRLLLVRLTESVLVDAQTGEELERFAQGYTSSYIGTFEQSEQWIDYPFGPARAAQLLAKGAPASWATSADGLHALMVERGTTVALVDRVRGVVLDRFEVAAEVSDVALTADARFGLVVHGSGGAQIASVLRLDFQLSAGDEGPAVASTSSALAAFVAALEPQLGGPLPRALFETGEAWTPMATGAGEVYAFRCGVELGPLPTPMELFAALAKAAASGRRGGFFGFVGDSFHFARYDSDGRVFVRVLAEEKQPGEPPPDLASLSHYLRGLDAFVRRCREARCRFDCEEVLGQARYRIVPLEGLGEPLTHSRSLLLGADFAGAFPGFDG